MGIFIVLTVVSFIQQVTEAFSRMAILELLIFHFHYTDGMVTDALGALSRGEQHAIRKRVL